MCLIVKTAKCDCGQVINYKKSDFYKRTLKVDGKTILKLNFLCCPKCFRKVVVNESENKKKSRCFKC